MHTRSTADVYPTQSHWFSDRAPLSRCDAWRNRALREISLVRRVIRGARAGITALGEIETMLALEDGAASELLMTSRFVERRPSTAVAMQRLATDRRTRVTMISGTAALELDLAGDGVGAMPHRLSPAHSAAC